MKNNVWDILQKRGFVKQVVFEEDLKKLLGQKSVTFYVGFDPTADSLHIGHYIPIMAMMHMQRAGHKPVILLGGGTGLVGDPSGRTDLRDILDEKAATDRVEKIKVQLLRFFDVKGSNAAIAADNADWLKNLNYIQFLREVGAHFSVNKMLGAECYKQRLEKGLTFLEFNYMLMQSYDFLELYKRYDCVLQIGGNDQWSNMLFGADLIRRKERADAYALTLPLLVSSNNTKMGKTSKGALWLDPDKTSPYDFYQYFRNVEDEKVEECLRLLTFVELDEIAEITKHKDARINSAKERLAYEVTRLIHGETAAALAESQAKGAFGGGGEMPSVTIKANAAASVVDVLFLAGAVQTKSEARRAIEGGGVKINDSKVDAVADLLSKYTDAKEFTLHKGKKVHFRVIIS